MGDAQKDNNFLSSYSNYPASYLPSLGRTTSSGMSDHPQNSREQHGSSSAQSSFSSQQQNNYYQQQQSNQSLQSANQQSSMNQATGLGRPSPLNMASLGAALPDYGQNYTQQPPQRFQNPSAQNAQLAFQIQQLHQYSQNQPPQIPPYNLQYSQQFAGMYGPNQGQSGQLNQQFYASQGFPQQQRSQGQQPQVSSFYYQQSSGFPGQAAIFPAAHFQAQFGNRMGVPGDKQPSRPHSNEHLGAGTIGHAGSTASSHGKSPIIRGPPRKPKQSGHALWVGNLPPGAKVEQLKDHFSRGHTNDILSVFLISKSNCAFVNYKSEEACHLAVQDFNESRFNGVRLLCRMRRTSVQSVPGVPTGPAALAQPQGQPQTIITAEQTSRIENAHDASEDHKNKDNVGNFQYGGHAKEKFFVVKSLTVEDLETSVRTGQWATQAHNEETLNKAYQTADNVYLIFSVNKSGEYFGYARMTSPMSSDPSKAIDFAPSAQQSAVEDFDLPKAYPTSATETAPKGRVIDDSARGTIFWEAQGNEEEKSAEINSDNQGDASNQASGCDSTGVSGDELTGETKAWGKPFSLEWMSTNRVPFYRTRGLRNAWNANREVKIARDGTELETGVGKRLIAMFTREHSPIGGPVMGAGVFPQMGMGLRY